MNFKLHLIETITNNFSEDQKVGSGGYGDVYKAVHNGEEIAVKKLHPLKGLDDKQFDNEFRNISKICHKNVVRLIGYCHESRRIYVEHEGALVFAKTMERVLCFEYMTGGSLEKHIQDESCGLKWPTCYKIIKGTCEGLNHLHSSQEKPIFHLDLKPGNILLDNSMTPKITDLGLSRLVASTKTCQTQIHNGTPGYMPPEYVDSGSISKKFDVFSLGVTIIKMMAGNMGYSRCIELSPKHFIELVCESWKKRCVDKDREKRPCVLDIVQELEELEAKVTKMSLTSHLSKDLTVQRSCDSNVIAVDPTLELRFLFEPRKEVSCCLQLTNKTDGFIAFNVKINQNKYRARPSKGTMPPCSKRYIVVTMEAQANGPPNMRCHDMLLVQSTFVSQDLASEETEIDYQELFNTTLTKNVVDVQLPIVYVILDL